MYNQVPWSKINVDASSPEKVIIKIGDQIITIKPSGELTRPNVPPQVFPNEFKKFTGFVIDGEQITISFMGRYDILYTRNQKRFCVVDKIQRIYVLDIIL